MHSSDSSVCADPSSLSKRLSHYGVAALAAAATGVVASDANAALVTLPVNINSTGSLETFIDILPFAAGDNVIAVNFVNNTFSGANPLAPNSELMLRGVAGFAQLRGNNGAAIACFISSSYLYVRDVGAAFTVPPLNAGTFMFSYGPPSYPNPSLTYPAFANGEFPLGSTGVAYFQFSNPGTGIHNGWATVQINGTATNLNPTITAIHVDTDPVPEPSSMALLCMGAAGLAAFRRKSAKPN